MWYIILFFATLLLDQITKIIVDANMALYDTIPVIDNALITFSITNHYNEGASFSFLANAEWAQTFFICRFIVQRKTINNGSHTDHCIV